MSDALRVPRQEDVREVARLTNESWPEPIDDASVLRDWSFLKLYEAAGMRVSACFAIYEKVIA
jgi:site-specific recombinase XerC